MHASECRLAAVLSLCFAMGAGFALMLTQATRAPSLSCEPGSRGNVCIVQRSPGVEPLGADTITSFPRTFGDGTYAVGKDIAPGSWTAPGGDSCAWARISGFDGTADETIDSASGQLNPTVTVATTDAGFYTAGCGIWTVALLVPPSAPPQPAAPARPSGPAASAPSQAACTSYTGGPCVTLCKDGLWSSSTGRGTCSGHGGEAH